MWYLRESIGTCSKAGFASRPFPLFSFDIAGERARRAYCPKLFSQRSRIVPRRDASVFKKKGRGRSERIVVETDRLESVGRFQRGETKSGESAPRYRLTRPRLTRRACVETWCGKLTIMRKFFFFSPLSPKKLRYPEKNVRKFGEK